MDSLTLNVYHSYPGIAKKIKQMPAQGSHFLFRKIDKLQMNNTEQTHRVQSIIWLCFLTTNFLVITRDGEVSSITFIRMIKRHLLQ